MEIRKATFVACKQYLSQAFSQQSRRFASCSVQRAGAGIDLLGFRTNTRRLLNHKSACHRLRSCCDTAEAQVAFRAQCLRFHNHSVKLQEVGRFEEPKDQGEKYNAGQLFLHRVFGYRGVILFPWTARVFDRDQYNTAIYEATHRSKNVTDSPPGDTTIVGSKKTKDLNSSFSSSSQHERKEVQARIETYYQVLIDSRDSPYIRAQTEAVTFLGQSPADASSRSLYAIPGLDYVAHSDILPYINTGSHNHQKSPAMAQSAPSDVGNMLVSPPILHELFYKFLSYNEDKGEYVARDTLLAWQDRNHPWLELSDVHRETTERVRITVIPFYMGYRRDSGQPPGSSTSTHVHHNHPHAHLTTAMPTPSYPGTSSSIHHHHQSSSSNSSTIGACVYWWRYSIRMENLGAQSVQLRERHWRIFSLSGTLETVRGRGVVGQEPVLDPRVAPAFQYSSHVSLQAPSGHMWGTFRFERSDGTFFDAKIPPFSLESKEDLMSS